MCQREIAYYRGLVALEEIEWLDLSKDPQMPSQLSRCDALKRFHVMDEQGRFWRGARAFLRLWQALPGWRWLALLRFIPFVPSMLELGYRLTLKVRPRLAAFFR
jgi:predicted DCC family thiol-disulfide oxidoreductase YuxK